VLSYALDDPAQLQPATELLGDEVDHAVEAGGVTLDDGVATVAVDHQARQAITLAVDEPVGVAVARQQCGSERERVGYPTDDQVTLRWPRPEQTHGDGAARRVDAVRLG